MMTGLMWCFSAGKDLIKVVHFFTQSKKDELSSNMFICRKSQSLYEALIISGAHGISKHETFHAEQTIDKCKLT